MMNGHTPLALAFDDDHRELRCHFPSLVVKSTSDATRRCALCGGGGGALLPTAEGAWAHGVCALYLPGVHLASDVEGGGLCAHGVPSALARPPLRAPPPPPDAAEAEAAAAADAAAACTRRTGARGGGARGAGGRARAGLGDRLGRRRGRRRRRGGGAASRASAHRRATRCRRRPSRRRRPATASSPRDWRAEGAAAAAAPESATADVCAMCGGGGGLVGCAAAGTGCCTVVRARRRVASARAPTSGASATTFCAPATPAAAAATTSPWACTRPAEWRPDDAARRAAARQGPAGHVDAALRSIARDETVEDRATVREADTAAAAGDEPAASVVGQGRARRRRPRLRPAARSAHLV